MITINFYLLFRMMRFHKLKHYAVQLVNSLRPVQSEPEETLPIVGSVFSTTTPDGKVHKYLYGTQEEVKDYVKKLYA